MNLFYNNFDTFGLINNIEESFLFDNLMRLCVQISPANEYEHSLLTLDRKKTIFYFYK